MFIAFHTLDLLSLRQERHVHRAPDGAQIASFGGANKHRAPTEQITANPLRGSRLLPQDSQNLRARGSVTGLR